MVHLMSTIMDAAASWDLQVSCAMDLWVRYCCLCHRSEAPCMAVIQASNVSSANDLLALQVLHAAGLMASPDS